VGSSLYLTPPLAHRRTFAASRFVASLSNQVIDQHEGMGRPFDPETRRTFHRHGFDVGFRRYNLDTLVLPDVSFR
jgi:hypothetical protein